MSGASGGGLRLALSLFSVAPVGDTAPMTATAPITTTQAARAVRWLPVVGAVIGLVSVLPALAVWRGGGHGSALLAAALVVTAQALLTRGLHLDGLADLADGLGSRRPAGEALAVMKQSDIGPFGVAAVVGCLLVQVCALSAVLGRDPRPAGAVVVLAVAVTARLAVLWAAGTGVPAARPGGFGALVAGTAGPAARVVSTAVVLAAAGGGLALAGAGAGEVGGLLGAQVAALLVAWLVRGHAVRRLGGVTGDVFGALIEIAATALLVVAAAEAAWR